jgi:glycosyltransferase involved in cell wall biosynthesis
MPNNRPATTPTRDYALVIPAYNEAATIRAIASAALEFVQQIIVVDDGSDDGTVTCLQGLPLTIRQHPYNKGKAMSLKYGFEQVLTCPLKGVITMDGDGQHTPDDIPRLLAAASQYPDRLIIGARLWNKAAIPLARYRANRFANFWIGWASGQYLEDSQSGFRIYPVDLLRKLRIKSLTEKSFVLESEILIEAARLGYSCVSVRVSTAYPQTARRSHFRPVRDIALITCMVARKLFGRGMYLPGLWRSLRTVNPTTELNLSNYSPPDS